MTREGVDNYYYYKGLVEKRLHNLKVKCKRRNIYIKLGQKEFRDWYISSKSECEYCGRKLEKGQLELDRKSPSIGYVISNIVFCCSVCNRVKSNIFTYEEMKRVAVDFQLVNKKPYS